MPLKYIYGQDELVRDFIVRAQQRARLVGAGRFSQRFTAIGVLDEHDELIAGLLYHAFNPDAGTIELSVEAIPGRQWLTRSTLAVMFQYPFIQCKCQMVITTTAGTNERVQRILAALNFKLITLPRTLGRGRDGVIGLLTYEDCMANKICRRFKHHVAETPSRKVA